MEHIKKLYREALEKHGDSHRSVLLPKGRQKERFFALTRHIKGGDGFSIMDFGCGLAHLKNYLDARFSDYRYIGVDMLPEFIAANQRKFPDGEFCRIDSYRDIAGSYDYVVASGTFNILYDQDPEVHQEMVFAMLSHLFERTQVYLAVDFMTDDVDYVQEGAYHQSVSALYEFVYRNLSKRIVLDQSYMPYEYTLTVHKDQTVLKPDLVYQ